MLLSESLRALKHLWDTKQNQDKHMFQPGVSTADDEYVDTLFAPTADDLKNAKKSKTDPKDDEPAKPDDDVATAEAIAAEARVAKSKAKPADEPAKPKVDELTEEEFEEELFPEAKPADDKKTPDAKAKLPLDKKTQTPPAEETEVDWQLLYKKLVDEGVWEEVEVPENTEWTADLFKKAQEAQIKSQYEDLLDKTGPYGKAIIQYERDGGNPSDLLGLFREQREVRDFDITAKEGQEEFLRSFLESQGNSEKSIERTIKALTDQGDEAFKEEAEEKKALWDAQYAEEIENTQREQALTARQAEADAKSFHKNITNTLTSDEEVSPKERKELTNYILNYSQVHRGKNVSQFYLDMVEIQKSPANYVELAKFIKGLKTGDYKKKVADKSTREVSAQSFLKIKNGSALKSPGGSSLDLESSDQSNFLTFLSKKKS